MPPRPEPMPGSMATSPSAEVRSTALTNVARILYMKSVTLAEARQSLSALINEVETFDEHVLITKNGRPTAVIISADEWEAIEDTAFWRSIPDIGNDIATARGERGIAIDEYLALRSTKPR
jgi:antitoxin YefM